MTQPIKLKAVHCDRLSFSAQVKKSQFRISNLQASLSEAYPKKKSGLKRVPFFVPIDAVTAGTDCHLHLNVGRGHDSEHLELELELMTLPRSTRTKPDSPFTLENIGTWLGSVVGDKELVGTGFGMFDYKGTHFRPVIPLPYSGALPIESSIIRKSSIAGLDVEVGESDIGLRRFFIYKPGPDTIALSVIFAFAHPVNYSLFLKLTEKAATISSVLVLEEKHEASVG